MYRANMYERERRRALYRRMEIGKKGKSFTHHQLLVVVDFCLPGGQMSISLLDLRTQRAADARLRAGSRQLCLLACVAAL